MLNKVARYVSRHRLLDKSHRYLVALSGGADSVCLLLTLKDLGYDVEAVHCNFKLRGKEADRDEQFCVDFCADHGVALHRVHFDTKAWARLHKKSIETAARELRYAYFAQLCRDLRFEAVCVAHHMNDSAETVLLNLVRGTGLNGLCGIRPVQTLRYDDYTLRVIRPLLCLRREEIEEELTGRRHIIYVTDSTNLTTEATRNKIRLEVMPLLESINPAAIDNIVRTSQRLGDAAEIVDERFADTLGQYVGEGQTLPLTISTDEIEHENLLFRLLEPYGFTPAQIEEIYRNLDGRQGAVFHSADHVLVFDRGQIVIDKAEHVAPQDMKLPMDGRYVMNETATLNVRTYERDANFQVSRTPWCATLDAQTVKFPLTARRVHDGDRFCPYGMNGSKLVSDYLTDLKLNLIEKQRQLVLTDADGEIIWIAGRRTDRRNCVCDETKRILELEITFKKS